MAKKKKMTLEEKLEEAIVKDAPYEVPGNWVWVKLNNGFAQCLDKFRKPVNATERANRVGEIPYYGATGQVGYIDDYLTDDNLVLVGEDGAPFFELLKNKSYIIKGKAWVNNHAHILKSNFGIIGNKYLMHYLNVFNFNGYVNGTTRLKLTQSSMNDIPIPLPPLKEQQRIVNGIESLFEKLDKAKELIQEARDGFEKRKAAILEKAFRGELTEPLDINIKEESLINNDIGFDIFNSRYRLSNLDKIIEEKPRNGYSPKAVQYETSTKTLKLGAITRGYFNSNEFKYIDEAIDKNSYLWLKNGDFLIQRANSLEYVGISAIYDMEDDIFIYPDLIMKFRVNKDVYNAKLLWYWINSRYGRWYFVNNATGTAGNMPKINQKIVMNLPIPVIPFEEQKEIVKFLDKLLGKESEIEELTQLENHIGLIKKSILAKAFRGELGTNCEEEESALELLKEILSKN